MTTAFVAGATGYTGQEVVRQLAASGMRAIAHVRPDSPALSGWHAHFTTLGARVDATPWELGAMTDSLHAYAPDVVFALLGTTRKRAHAAARAGAPPSDYEAVDYGLTHLLLEAMRAARPNAHFVYLSAIGARTDTRNAYLQVRGRIEQELLPSGLTYTIARPGLITGEDRPERRPLENAAAVAFGAATSLLSAVGARHTADRVRPITARQLARALIVIAADPRGANRVVKSAELHARARQ